MLTIHGFLHTLDKTVNNSESLSRGCLSLVLRQSVQPAHDRLDVLVPEEVFLQKFDYVALSEVTPSESGLGSLDRRCLSSSVTRASVDIRSTIILTTVSTIEGAREICVYMLRRPTKRSIDSSKSAIASQLGCTPFAAWFTRMSQIYPHILENGTHIKQDSETSRYYFRKGA